jgi:alkylhydroperoxidase family enzyme
LGRYLIVAHQTAGSPELRDHVKSLSTKDPAAVFTVLAPATPASHLFTWEEGESKAIAERNATQAADLLREAGVRVDRVVVGSRFPLDAIADELRAEPGYDGIVICTFPAGVSRWLKLDLVNQARKRTGLPVTHITAQPVAESPGARPRAGPPLRAEGATTVAEPRSEAHPAGGEIDVREANLLEVLGHSGLLRAAYESLWQAIEAEPALGASERELAALRAAMLSRSPYTWHHRVLTARRAGVSDAAIFALEHWRSAENVRFSEREWEALAYAEALLGHPGPGDSLERAQRRVEAIFEPAGVVALNLAIGLTRAESGLALAFRLETEQPFVGWQPF